MKIVQFFQFIASYVRAIWQIIRYGPSILQEIKRDPLTSLFNHRFLNQEGKRILEQAKRSGTNLFLAFLDIDGLKQVNDTYGHHTGDEILKLFAELMSLIFRRKTDWLGRYQEGADEFWMIIISDDKNHTVERLDLLVSRFESSVNDLLRARDSSCDVSASYGIVFLRELPYSATATLEQLIYEAEQMMYRQKRNKGQARA